MAKRRSNGGHPACAIGNIRAISEILTVDNFMTSFPESIADVICRSARRVAVSPWALGLPVVSVATYCLGPLSEVVITSCDWKTRVLNWSIAVSSSGGGKTQAYNKVQKAVTSFEEQINDEVKERMISYLEENKVPVGTEAYEDEMRNAGFVKVAVDGAVTFERLFNILLSNKDHSGLLNLEEGMQFFESLDCFKKGNADRITALKLRGGGAWTRETVSEKDKRSCELTHLVVCGYTQPDPIAREIEKVPNDGLMNRWTICFLPQLYPKFDALRIPVNEQNTIKDDDNRLTEIFYRLYKLAHDEDGTARKVTWILDGDAELAFEKEHDRIQTVLQSLYDQDQGEKGGFLSKAKGDALAIAGAYEAIMTICDPNYPSNLSVGNVYKISENSVAASWGYILLLLRQRVHFENDPVVSKIVSKVLDWQNPYEEDGDDKSWEQKDDDKFSLSVLEKRAVKLFDDFKDAKTIARGEASRKRKYGSIQQIDELFSFLSSEDDGGSHCFGSCKRAKKYPFKKKQPVFFKEIPEEGSQSYVEIVNKLTKLGLKFKDFYNRESQVVERLTDVIEDAEMEDDEDDNEGEENDME